MTAIFGGKNNFLIFKKKNDKINFAYENVGHLTIFQIVLTNFPTLAHTLATPAVFF